MAFKNIIFRNIILICSLISCQQGKGQFLMDILDTTSDVGRSVLSVSRKFDNLRISGYIQSQYQVASAKGIATYSGGDFMPHSSNRFMLRRGRIRFDYAHFPESKGSSVHFVFQFDGTERGVAIRDFWGRIMENRFKLFSITAGLFARPFSYELNLSSSDRESPERGRMSQILMKTERDMGVMLSFEPRVKTNPLHYIKVDAGIFNGQGLSGPAEFDNHKDFISRIYLNSYPLKKDIHLSLGASMLLGGITKNTKFTWTTVQGPSGKIFVVDSSINNIGKSTPRKYFGGDAQLKIKTKIGITELRAEFMAGKQSAFKNSSETPSLLPVDPATGFYVRKFNGAYFYFLQNIFNNRNQLIFKYDWYDPNREIKEKEIGALDNNLTAADIRFNTFGAGFTHQFSKHSKLIAYYDHVINEKTSLSGFLQDVADDVLTLRLQFRF